MFSMRRFYNWIQQLTMKAESDNFIVHYGLRNPAEGRGLGPMGVRWEWLVPSYLDALERAHRTMTVDFNRQQPRTGPGGKTLVYVGELSEFTGGSPFTFDDPLRGPIIALPSRSEEPTCDRMAQRAIMEAVHETAHVFNFSSRPNLTRFNPDPWTWFDEATAVTLERTVLPSNADSVRFGMHWTDEPETPLDSERFWYESYPFVSHICRRFGPAMVGRIWEEARSDPQFPVIRPLEVLSRLTGGTGTPYNGKDLKFEQLLCDFFTSAYFSWDQQSWSFAPDLFARHGERNLTESFVCRQVGKNIEATDRLDHMAARYYRISTRTAYRELEVTVTPKGPKSRSPLYAAVTAVSERGWRPGPAVPLVRSPRASLELSRRLTPEDPNDVNHFIVVIANCGLRGFTGDAKKPHDDGQQFTIRVKLIK